MSGGIKTLKHNVHESNETVTGTDVSFKPEPPESLQ